MRNDIITTLYGKLLILKNVYDYDGPITLQYLPIGGIQAIFDNAMIINSRYGFIATEEVVYDGIRYTIRKFKKKFPNLVNLVLPI